MRVWQSISWAEADQLTEIAKFAEEVGFYGVINSEHLFLTHKTGSDYPYTEDGKMNHALDYDYPDVWVSFAAMAAVTKTLRFSSSVYLLPLRKPHRGSENGGHRGAHQQQPRYHRLRRGLAEGGVQRDGRGFPYAWPPYR
jgi:hypothetical protein